MVWRSILVFVFLFAGYNFAITHLGVESRFFQNQWGRNISVVEDYILDEQARDYVIVGSSLAARLESDQLGPRIGNLSFAGGSAATGLDIVLRTRPLPKVVLIETNVVRDLDRAFADARCDPLQTFLRRHIPSSRVKYQPVNVLLNVLRRNAKRKDQAPNPNAFATAFAVQVADAQVIPDRSGTEQSVLLLSNQVKALMDQQVEVLFFRMPVNPEIAGSPRSAYLRGIFDSYFPSPKFMWLPDAPGPFDTDDGIHLTSQSARDYAGAFRKALLLMPTQTTSGPSSR